MDRWSELNTFITVVEEAGFAPAAKRLGVAPSSVSRLVASLEARLDVRLMNRTTRRFSLTNAGELLYLQGRKALQQFEEAESEARGMIQSPVGLLTVACDDAMRGFLMPQIAKLRTVAPELSIDVIRSHGEAADLTISTQVIDGQRSRHIAEFGLCTFAAPSYVSDRPALNSPNDLSNHSCLTLNRDTADQYWQFKSTSGTDEPFHIRGMFRAETQCTLRDAALIGMGIAQAPKYAILEDLAAGRLVEVLTDFTGAKRYPIFACYPSATQTPLKTRVMMDVLSEAFL
ncbi:MAG: LysR family transcriptional regulator [Pseudoruegeria sp.]